MKNEIKHRQRLMNFQIIILQEYNYTYEILLYLQFLKVFDPQLQHFEFLYDRYHNQV